MHSGKIMKDKFINGELSSENWMKLTECLEIRFNSDSEKIELKNAFKYLLKEFGEDFLDEFINWKHPLPKYFIEFGNEWLLWFVKALKESKYYENYSSLINRLKNKNKFSEGLSVLEICYKFSKIGYKIEIDPLIFISEKVKEPDLKMSYLNGNEIFIEISVLNISEMQKVAQNITQKIIQTLWNYQINYSFRVYKSLDDNELEKLLKKVREKARIVEKKHDFQELIIKDTIELGMAPENKEDLLKKWGIEKKLKPSECIGVPLNELVEKEILRAMRKIQIELKQLPYNKLTGIIINVKNLLFHLYSIEKIVVNIEKKMNEYPNLSFVIFHESHMEPGVDINYVLKKEQYIIIKAL